MTDFTNYLQDLQENIQRGGERSHYPALKSLIESLAIGINAIIEEKGNQAGIPDLTIRKNDGILIGYIEAKDINVNLSKTEKTQQLKRYLESSIGYNLILTNYLEFRWYVDGECEKKAKLGDFKQDKVTLVQDTTAVAELLQSFLTQKAKDINNYDELAREMAAYTKTIRYAIESALILEENNESESRELHQLQETFKNLLLPDIDNERFADMYAQTIAYGLFTARIGHAQNPGQFAFNRITASAYISDRIPFLKGLFDIVIATDSLSTIHKSIELLVDLLNQVNMTSVLEHFGRETRTEDPIFHFYETFLAEYEYSLRKSRGVYYTPEPVVKFIVRAVNELLDQVFDLDNGLGHRRVTILDPATGTGTFLYEVIRQIYQHQQDRFGVSRWDNFLRDKKLLKRLFGFEILMTPYTIAHLKLGLLLTDIGYKFQPHERLRIYLTNALEEGIKQADLILSQIIAEEASQAGEVKTEIPIIVVLGNPPYSVSSQNESKRKFVVNQETRYLADVEYTGTEWNKIYKTAKPGSNITELTHIGEMLERYKGRVRLEGEKNIQPLDDDYIKFIRFAHDQIEKTGYGIIGFITNHSYINGLIHRGMREELLKYFDRLYIMDLHGNSLLKETAPDGSIDQNVFDIQQGVAILIAVREKSEPDYFSKVYKSRDGVKEMAEVYYYDLWGSREYKYDFLAATKLNDVEWIKLQPTQPNYFFKPTNTSLSLEKEYQNFWSLQDIFISFSNIIETGKDSVLINFDQNQIKLLVQQLANPKILDEQIAEIYQIEDSANWNFFKSRLLIIKDGVKEELISPVYYRPFDIRFTYYHEILRRRQEKVLRNLLQENLGLLAMRQVATGDNQYTHFMVCKHIADNRCFFSNRGRPTMFPLYTYPNTENSQTSLFIERTPNLSPKFLQAIKEKLNYTPTPEEIFYYAYAIFHSPTYRTRYAEFLKIDFPRLPLTNNRELFNSLTVMGEELVNLHLLKSEKLNNLITVYETSGNNQVTEVNYNSELQRVKINNQSYFSGVPSELWEFKIGGYQVLEKWLKDRKSANRILSPDEITHYQKIVVALQETLRLMQEIDNLIPAFPIV
ncbi:MAG TPA: type ISP restriction/modification enzyme [Nostocaceae cyanobacterium]|nr:type ISP restriction/modification enzyme [Nostocaceae cyanobacterium]